jgi:hypothetical protein
MRSSVDFVKVKLSLKNLINKLHVSNDRPGDFLPLIKSLEGYIKSSWLCAAVIISNLVLVCGMFKCGYVLSRLISMLTVCEVKCTSEIRLAFFRF